MICPLLSDTERNHAPADDGARVLALLAGLINKLEFASFESAPLEHQPAVRLLLACMPHLQSAAASEAARKYSAFAAALCQVLWTALTEVVCIRA